MPVGGGDVFVHFIVAGNVENAVEDRDLDRRGRSVGQRRYGVGELCVLMPAEVGQELRFANDVLAVEAAYEIEPLVAAIAEMLGGKRFQF